MSALSQAMTGVLVDTDISTSPSSVIDLLVVGIVGSGRHTIIRTAFHSPTTTSSVRIRFATPQSKTAPSTIGAQAVWYVIDCTRSRLLPYEASLIRSIADSGTPIACLLNKSDLCSSDQLRAIANQVADAFGGSRSTSSSSSSLGVFATVATPAWEEVNSCPECGDDDISVHGRTHGWSCCNCGAAGELHKIESGLGPAVDATRSTVAPPMCEIFDSAQTVSLRSKFAASHDIIVASSASPSIDTAAAMLARLARVWNVADQLACAAEDDRLGAVLRSAVESRSVPALGIMWSLALLRLFMSIGSGPSSPLESVLSSIDEAELESFASRIQESPFEQVFECAFRGIPMHY